MQGFVLLATFLVMALIAAALAITLGIVIDKLPRVHDLLSVMAFFGTLVVALPVCWWLAVRFTEPRAEAKS